MVVIKANLNGGESRNLAIYFGIQLKTYFAGARKAVIFI